MACCKCDYETVYLIKQNSELKQKLIEAREELLIARQNTLKEISRILDERICEMQRPFSLNDYSKMVAR